MTTVRSTARGAALVSVIALLAACSADRDGSPVRTADPAPTTLAAADAAALTAYAEFWRISEQARVTPGARDWRAALSAVATGQALDTVLGDIENYASLPAHAEGPIRRDARIESVAGSRATVVDCLDVSDRRLVSDTTGRSYDDLANRVVRYRYRADLQRDATGSWLVERTAPALDQPC